MISYADFYAYLEDSPLAHWLDTVPALIDKKLDTSRNGNLQRWYDVLASLPDITPTYTDLNADRLLIGSADDQPAGLRDQLLALHPWRKGPYDIFGIHIDTEWRSDWKWQRLESHLSDLTHRTVLDVGCGNGYFCWRLLGAGAARVIGIDPNMLSVSQFQLIKHFIGQHLPIDLLPLGIEQVPPKSFHFDTVLSMGVLYHRRSPIDHLYELAACLKPGGELVLETLVIEGEEGMSLVPADRYAQMRNVWFIPSCATLHAWLARCGFDNIRLVDVSTTTAEEQRSTEWMHFHSLPEFLDPADSSKTIEGYPAPKRAMFLASLD